MFDGCYELAPVFKLLGARPTQLELYPHETFPTTRRVDDTAAAPTIMPDLASLAEYVFQRASGVVQDMAARHAAMEAAAEAERAAQAHEAAEAARQAAAQQAAAQPADGVEGAVAMDADGAKDSDESESESSDEDESAARRGGEDAARTDGPPVVTEPEPVAEATETAKTVQEATPAGDAPTAMETSAPQDASASTAEAVAPASTPVKHAPDQAAGTPDTHPTPAATPAADHESGSAVPISRMTVAQLRAELVRRGVDVSGLKLKKDFVARLESLDS